MSSFSNPNYDASGYQKFRPDYPHSLYEHLTSYIGETKPSVVVDVACGTGQATRVLAQMADKVYGIDRSEVMIKQACDQRDLPSNIEFLVGEDAKLDHMFPPHSVDLLTVAEAFHYLTHPDFLNIAHKILKPNGVLAIWSYYLPSVFQKDTGTELTEARQVIYNLTYGELAPYWDKGLEIIHDMYASFKLPPSQFTQEVRYVNDNDRLRPQETFELVRTNAKLSDLINSLRTSRPYNNWKKANPQSRDILDLAYKEIKHKAGLEDNDFITVKWNTVYIFARAI